MRILKHLWGMMIVSGLVCFLSCGDSNPGTSGSDLSLPIQELLDAPEQLDIDNYSFALEAGLWRDFMPVSPPDGHPLIAVATAIVSLQHIRDPYHRVYTSFCDASAHLERSVIRKPSSKAYQFSIVIV